MQLHTLISGLALRLASAELNPNITHLTDDSRRVQDGSLFIARTGSQADGSQYIADAIDAGAAAILTSMDYPAIEGIAHVRADHVADALFDLTARFYDFDPSKLKLAAVTGTNGKTTTAYMLRHILNHTGNRAGLIGTIEIDDGKEVQVADLTTPGTIDLVHALARMQANGCAACVMETSSHALHQGRLAGLRFQSAAFTNLSGDHLDYHKTLDAYADAKALLFEALDENAIATINQQDPHGERMALGCKATVQYFQIVEEANGEAPIQAVIHNATAAGIELTVYIGQQPYAFTLPLAGEHNVQNALAAFGLALGLGLEAAAIAEALACCPTVPGRLESVRLKNFPDDFSVFVDYAHTDDALINVMNALRPLTKNKLHVLVGCGGDRDRTKRPRMAAAACKLGDQVIITSDNPRTEHPDRIIADMLEGVQVEDQYKVNVIADRKEAIGFAIAQANAGDIILLAGKGHEDYQIIGTEKIDFDDRVEAAAALKLRQAGEKV